MQLGVGQVINNRYRVVKLLGQGGFGAVYRAWDLNLNIPVALKENTETSIEAARQFAREASILASLRHPNLPKVTDYFVLPDLGQYLVMEYIEGQDLLEKLEANLGPLPVETVLDWADQILSALRYLHNQSPPIIHRDIKPQNIRLTPEGQAMLVDFGIAKLADTSKKTTIGARAVTPGYSPHEQYGQGATDQRSDIYALGATLYTLFTAQVPPESIARISEDPLVSPRVLNPGLPEAVAVVLMRALEVDPRKRWQTVDEFRSALKSAIAVPDAAPVSVQRQAIPSTIATSAPAPAVPVPSSRPHQAKSRAQLVGIGLGLLFFLGALVVGAIILFQTLDRAGKPKLTSAVMAPTQLSPPVTSSQPQAVTSGEPIRIGLLAPLSGPVPLFGISTEEGVQMAIDEWNERGGVLGRQVALVVADSQCSPDPAINAASKLIDQDGVKYLVGEVCSSASIPVSEIVNQKKVVQISPASTNLAVTVGHDGQVRPFTFRACFIDSFQGMVMARFAREQGHSTAFIMFDEGNDYGRSLAESFEVSFRELGGEIVGKEPYTGGQTEFTPILEKVKASRAAVLYLPDYYNVASMIAVQVRQQDIPVVMMGGDGWDSAELDVRALNGSFYTNHYDPGDDRPIFVHWVRRYGEIYTKDGQPKVPDALAALGYDAANLMLAAIERAGKDDPTRVAEALANLSWEGVTGNFSYDQHHNPVKNVVIVSVRDGGKFFYTSVQP